MPGTMSELGVYLFNGCSLVLYRDKGSSTGTHGVGPHSQGSGRHAFIHQGISVYCHCGKRLWSGRDPTKPTVTATEREKAGVPWFTQKM